MKEYPAAKIATVTIPSDGVYGAYYCQAINATAPHPWRGAALAGVPLLRPGQLLWLKGFSHPARFTDMVAPEGRPEGAAQGAACGGPLREGEVREPGAADEGQGAIVTREWPTKVGSRPEHDRDRSPTVPAAGASRPRGVPRSRGSASFRSSPTRSLFLLPPAAQVLVGAFKGVDGGFTLDNVRRCARADYLTRLQDQHRGQPRHGALRRAARAPDRLRRRSARARRAIPLGADDVLGRRGQLRAASRSRSRSSPRSARSGS